MQSECKTDEYGHKLWILNGKYHREEGPAIEWNDGDKHWYKNGELHREDGPAVEYADGTKKWYVNGNLHRLDGPAIVLSDGDKYWYIDGENYTFKQWLEYVWDSLSIEEQERYIFNGFEYAE